MANRHIRSCSTLLRNTNQTTLRYHLTLFRMVIIKKSTNNKCWRGCGEKRTLLHYGWECKLLQLLHKTAWRFLTKLKIELPYGSARAFQAVFMIKNLLVNTGDIRDADSIREQERPPGRRPGNPLQYFCLEKHMDRGAWWTTVVHRVTQNRT